MKIFVISLFPEIFPPVLQNSILKRAQDKKLVEYYLVNLRDFGQGQHRSVDDRPYGGGAGMVLKADVLKSALVSLPKPQGKRRVILTSASGQTLNQNRALELSRYDELVLICGHYEGVDQRFIDQFVEEEISIGDYVLTGGELPAMIVIDSVTRLVEGVLSKLDATKEESFSMGMLEYPHYTRPEIFEGNRVPEVLLSGNHKGIANWRKKQALAKTTKIRPDLLKTCQTH